MSKSNFNPNTKKKTGPKAVNPWKARRGMKAPQISEKADYGIKK